MCDPSNTNTSKRLRLNFATLKLSQEKEEKGNKICSLKRRLVNVLPELGSIPTLLRLKFVEKENIFCEH